MISRFVRSLSLVGALSALVAMPAAAQLSANLGALSGDNAKGYLSPLPKALSGTLNSSIFQSGAVGKMGVSFNIGVKVMGVTLDGDRTYSPKDPPGFDSGGQPFEAPTVVGDVNAVAQQGQGGATLYHPGGFDIDNFGVAVPQLEIGNIAGTRAVVRWISLDLGDTELGKFSLFGVGGQHSVSQYIPGLPVDVAAGFFYQGFKLGDQDLIETSAWHADLTGSKRFGMIQPYIGVGYDSFKMDVNYEDASSGQAVAVDFDPETNAHFTAGAALLLPFMRLTGEFNAAAETGVAVGLSFGR